MWKMRKLCVLLLCVGLCSGPAMALAAEPSAPTPESGVQTGADETAALPAAPEPALPPAEEAAVPDNSAAQEAALPGNQVENTQPDAPAYADVSGGLPVPETVSAMAAHPPAEPAPPPAEEAADMLAPAADEDAPKIIDSFSVMYSGAAALVAGRDVRTLDPAARVDVRCRYTITGGVGGVEIAKITDWAYDDFNSNIVGTQNLMGRLQIPEGLFYYDEGGTRQTEVWLALSVRVVEGRIEIAARVESTQQRSLLLLPRGGDIAQAAADQNAVTTMSYYLRSADGRSLGTETFDMVWAFDSFDSNTLGRSQLRGRVDFSASTYVWHDENGDEASKYEDQEVFVYEAGMPVLETVDPVYNLHLPATIAKNDTAALLKLAERIDHVPTTYALITPGAEDEELTFTAPLRFDSAAVDLKKAGKYYPLWCDLPGMEACYSTNIDSVIVLEEDVVDLTGIRFFNDTSNRILRADWLYKASDPEVWVLKDLDPFDEANADRWEQLFLGSGRFPTEPLRQLHEDSLQLDLWHDFFEPGACYYFQVRYEGKASNIASITISEEQVIALDIVDGNKDGGDAEEDAPPVLEQPAKPQPETPATPQPPQDSQTLPAASASAQPWHTAGEALTKTQPGAPAQGSMPPAAQKVPEDGLELPTAQEDGLKTAPVPGTGEDSPVLERVSETETTVTGQRLADMLARQGRQVVFSKEGIRLLLSAAYVEGLGLEPQDTFSVTLENRGNGQGYVGVAVNGKALPAIAGSRLELDYTAPADGVEVHVTGPDGALVPAVVYNHSRGLVSFGIQMAGQYTASTNETAETVQPVAVQAKPLQGSGLGGVLPVAIILLIGGAGAGLLFLLRWREKRVVG